MQEYMTRFMPMTIEQVKGSKSDVGLKIVGFGNVFNEKDYHDDILCRGAFKESLNCYKKAGKLPEMYLEHEAGEFDGQWTHVEEEAYGLKVAGVITCKETISRIKIGEITGLSIGFRVREEDIEMKIMNRYNAEKGRVEPTKVRLIKNCQLIEISLVSRPANAVSRFYAEGVIGDCNLQYAQ